MENQTKSAISETLKSYIARYESQNKAANSLKGVSSATISQMINGNWEQIKDDMWRNVAAQVGYNETEWVAVETRDFRILTQLLQDSQMYSNVFAVTGAAGTGKTFTLRQYAAKNRRTYLLNCAEFWNKKMFLQELLASMGRDGAGSSVAEMMYEIVLELKRQDNPIIILDEADKLSDLVLYFFITLYNQLEDQAGIILCATNFLDKRIKRGVKRNTKGYNEIYSRIGRKCVELKGLSQTDIAAVCRANGIDQDKQISEVIADCDGDLRMVKRRIHALKNMA